ncbi:MAG: DUF6503 family protein [Bacteroidota bacterium]
MSKFYFLLLALLIACSSPETTEETTFTPQPDLPEVLVQAIEAHGGWETWQSMSSMQYDIAKDSMTTETHLIDLQNRKVRITTKPEQFTLGFDGTDVWIAPDLAAFGESSARFYHNLLFYFYAMPFIVTDPGIQYETVEGDSLNGKIYDALKVSYDGGVGDAPDDEYILYFDKETHQMEWLLYTVTYFSGEKSDKYRALNYADWQEVNGLQLPRLLSGYTFENDSIGTKRYDRVFENVKLKMEAPDQSLFEMPEGAEISPLNE